MKISVTCSDFPQFDGLNIASVTDSPLKRLFQALAASMGRHPAFLSADPLLDAQAYPEIAFPAKDACIPVTVLLAGDKDVFDFFEVDGDHVTGAFLVNSGPFNDEQLFSDAFRVVVVCDEKVFLQAVRHEREQELDPCDSRHDAEYLDAAINTLTHELAHARDFIVHSHGLTPCLAELWMDEGALERDFVDLTTGRWIRPDMEDDALLDDQVAIERMEQRVEAQGYQWLSDCCGNAARAEPLSVAYKDCLQWMEKEMRAHFSPTRHPHPQL